MKIIDGPLVGLPNQMGTQRIHVWASFFDDDGFWQSSVGWYELVGEQWVWRGWK